MVHISFRHDSQSVHMIDATDLGALVHTMNATRAYRMILRDSLLSHHFGMLMDTVSLNFWWICCSGVDAEAFCGIPQSLSDDTVETDSFFVINPWVQSS